MKHYLRQRTTKDDKKVEETSWKPKPLRRMYHWQEEEVSDIRKAYQCLGQHKGSDQKGRRTDPKYCTRSVEAKGESTTA